MIDLVLPEARLRFAGALMQMHHDRKLVFVDRLGWRLPSAGSWLEIDEYDNEFAVYLLAMDEAGQHQGSVRLMPSTRRHMLQVMFPELCSNGVPVAETCWEISRLVINPSRGSGIAALAIHRLLALALAEFAQLNGIVTYSLVAEPQRVPALLAIGWRAEPLGLPMLINGEHLQAIQINIEPDTLIEMRRRFRVSCPVLKVCSPERHAA
jgi:acyl-homoserine lactone synthase